MVSGRLVIGFSARDWLLRFLFRGSSANVSLPLLVAFGSVLFLVSPSFILSFFFLSCSFC